MRSIACAGALGLLVPGPGKSCLAERPWSSWEMEGSLLLPAAFSDTSGTRVRVSMCPHTCSAGQGVLLQDPAPRGRGAAALWGWAQEVQNLRGEPHGCRFWHKKQAGSCETPSLWVQLLSPGAEGFLQRALLAGILQEIGSFLTAVVLWGQSSPSCCFSVCVLPHSEMSCRIPHPMSSERKVLVVPQLLLFPGGVLTEERDSWYPCSCCVWSSFAFNQREKDFGHPPKVPADMQQ